MAPNAKPPTTAPAADPWAVAQLRLDPKNPRLPADLTDASPDELLIHFEREYNLEELAWSMIEKGYSGAEPL